jgi:YHS domain-containing protein
MYKHKIRQQPDEETGEQHRDPVCGMEVSGAGDETFEFEYKGRHYYFCSRNCRKRFEADPEKYLNPESSSDETDETAGRAYTCPMHPEVRQDAPGDCPKCGMALEPETPKAIKFKPTKVGTYPFYCSKKFLFFEGHREKGMEGVIEVVP